MEIIALILN